MLGGHGDFRQTSFGGSPLLFGSCGNNTLRWGLSEVLPGLLGEIYIFLHPSTSSAQ